MVARSLGHCNKMKASDDVAAGLKGEKKSEKTSGFRDFEKSLSGVSKFLDFAFRVNTVPAMTRDRNHE